MLKLSINIQTILVGMGIGLFVYYVIKRMRYRLPPGPWCIPLIGHYKIYSSPEIHLKTAELAKEYGPIVRLSVGPQTWVVLNDINSVLEAMVKKKADFAGRPQITSGDVFTEGGKDIALGNYSASWKFHRKIAGKALRNYLQGDLLENMIQDNMNKFLDKMAEEKGPFVFKEYADLIIFHQLYTICFGEKRPVDDPEVKRFIKLDNDLLEKFGSGFFEDLFPYLKNIFTTAKWKKLLVLTEDILNVLRKKLKEHEETFQPGVNRDFIDSMLIAKQEAKDEGNEAALEILDDTHLVQTISDIFFAGVDTTRYTMDWFVYFMTRFPETQAKCQEEIDRVVERFRFNDGHFYREIEECEVSKTMNKIKRFTKKFENHLTEKEMDYLLNFETKNSNFYGLPKIHKSKELKDGIEKINSSYIKLPQPGDLKLRPIVAGPSCPTQRLSNLIDIILKPLCNTIPSFIRDDMDFLNHLPKNVENNTTLVSFDVTSLYTNIPHN